MVPCIVESAMGANSEPLDVLTSVPHEFEAEMIVGALHRYGIQAASTGGFVSNFKAEAPGNVRVLVKRSDLERAVELLDEMQEDRDFRQGRDDESSAVCDKSGRVLEDEDEDQESAQLDRAWKASILGLVVFPPLLNLYSLWLLLKHDLLAGDAQSANWRAQATLCLNLFAILYSLGFLLWFLLSF
jgi:pentatricopeptide repeat protein